MLDALLPAVQALETKQKDATIKSAFHIAARVAEEVYLELVDHLYVREP